MKGSSHLIMHMCKYGAQNMYVAASHKGTRSNMIRFRIQYSITKESEREEVGVMLVPERAVLQRMKRTDTCVCTDRQL